MWKTPVEEDEGLLSFSAFLISFAESMRNNCKSIWNLM